MFYRCPPALNRFRDVRGYSALLRLVLLTNSIDIWILKLYGIVYIIQFRPADKGR